MSITQRILLLLAVSLLALLALGGDGLWEQQRAKSRFDAALDNMIPNIHDLNSVSAAFVDIRGAIIKDILATTPDGKKAAEDMVAEANQQLEAALASYAKNDLHGSRDQELLAADRAAFSALKAATQKLLTVSEGNDMVEINHEFRMGPIANATNEFRKAIAEHIEFNMQSANAIRSANEHAFKLSMWITSGMILGIALVVAALGGQVFSSIRKGLQNIQRTLQQVSSSLDFTMRAPIIHNDEIGSTATAFNGLLARLQDNLQSLLRGAQDVAAASQTLSRTAAQVATVAESQNASTVSVASTVQQMTLSVQHVADRAQQTQALATTAGELAANGSTTIAGTISDIRQISSSVDEAAESIRELDQYNAQVNAVVSVIKEIADQTNLLALNASIEAARAGESGRGFAVVADEVRKLAERTSHSTQQISSTLAAMQERSRRANQQMQTAEALVKHSVARADDADHAIKQIGESTHNTVDRVSEISAAIAQQGSSTSHIARQVEQIAGMSEQASAAARETAANAQQMDRLAQGQMATLSQYRF